MNNIWETCLDLCLEGINSGSLGISAVITNAHNVVIAKGRNQLFDNRNSCNKIKNTVVSHAEINALANLPHEYRDDRNLTIYTTVEPCPMCLGALSMSHVRKIVIGSHDDFAGAIRLIEKDWYLEKKKFTVEYINGNLENLFFMLHGYSLLINRGLAPTHDFFNTIQKRYGKNFARLLNLKENDNFVTAIENKETNRLKKLVDSHC